METLPADAGSAASGTTPTAAPKTTAPAAGFTQELAAQLKRIEAHATKVEVLANGAKLYHLPGGREIEAAPGKSPYVVKKGSWPAKAAPKPTTPTTTPATGATTPAAGTTAPTTGTTTPATGTTAPAAGTTTPATGTPTPTAGTK